MELELGWEGLDIVTSFSGIVVSRVSYLDGAVQYGLQPRVLKNDGTPAEVVYFDQQRVTHVGKGILKPSDKSQES